MLNCNAFFAGRLLLRTTFWRSALIFIPLMTFFNSTLARFSELAIASMEWILKNAPWVDTLPEPFAAGLTYIPTLLLMAALAFCFLLCALLCLAVWRSAGRDRSNPLWTMLARGVVVLALLVLVTSLNPLFP